MGVRFKLVCHECKTYCDTDIVNVEYFTNTDDWNKVNLEEYKDELFWIHKAMQFLWKHRKCKEVLSYSDGGHRFDIMYELHKTYKEEFKEGI